MKLTILKNKIGALISSGGTGNAFDLKKMKIPASGKLKVDLKKYDGFIAVFK